MPNPLLNPQLDDASQISLLGTTLMNLLKKNILEPFQLTLLNIGVTNFVGAKGGAGRVAVLLRLSCVSCIEWHICSPFMAKHRTKMLKTGCFGETRLASHVPSLP